MQNRILVTESQIIAYITQLGYRLEELENSKESYGLFGLGVYIAIQHRDLESVKQFLPSVAESYINRVFTSHCMTPEIMAYFLQNRVISIDALNKALNREVLQGGNENVAMLLAMPGVDVFYYTHDISLIGQAVFNQQPELVQMLVEHVIRSPHPRRQIHEILNRALLTLADNQGFQRILCHIEGEEDEAALFNKNTQEMLTIAQILIENGANVNVRDRNGSVLEHAQNGSHLEPFIEFIRQQQAHNVSVSPVTLFKQPSLGSGGPALRLGR